VTRASSWSRWATARRGRLLVVALAVLVVALGAVVGTAPGRRLARRVLGAWAEHQRAQLAIPEDPFGMLAASQVGYAPGMVKRFSSPRAFDRFQVVREIDGAVVLERGPDCEQAVSGLGPVARVWMGDFSALTAPGRYRLEAAGLRSHPFEVGAEVFDDTVRAVERAFYFQRAFTAVEPAHAEGPWIHPSDAELAPPGVRGGWHDAGDFSLYSASLNSALFWLQLTAADFSPDDDDRNIPESGNGIPDLLDETRWGLEWLLSMQDTSGGFRNTTCQEHYGPYGTNLPHRMRPYRSGEVGTLATARAVGNLATAAALFRRRDPAFADRALEAAWRGQRYLDANPGTTDGPTCPAYRADGNEALGREARTFAAAGMLLGTGDARFREDFDRFFTPADTDPSYMKVQGFAVRLYLRAPAGDPARKDTLRELLARHAERTRAEGDRDAFQRSAPTFWGSLGAGFVRTGYSAIPRCLADPRAAAADCAQALANVHHLLGRNLLHFSYVSGLPGVFHERSHAFHHWFAALHADPYLPPGFVAGGPNAAPEPADRSNPAARPIPLWGYWEDPAFPRDAQTPYEQRYTDNDSYSTNEVSLDWQGPVLYGLHFARWVARHPETVVPVEPRTADGKLSRCDPSRASE
jgi:endoglucanase